MTTQPQTAEPAKSPAPEPTKPAKKPRGLIRWGVAIVFFGGAAAFAFAGTGPAARWAIERYGSAALGAPVTVGQARFDPLRLELTLTDVVAKDKASARPDGGFEKDLFSAKEVVARLDLGASLRGQVVIDEVRASGVRGRAVREQDGTINVGKQGGGPLPAPGEAGGPEAPPPGTRPDDPTWRKKLEEKAKERDLVEDLKSLLRKLKERRDREVARKEKERERRRQLGAGDPLARAEWVRPERPLFVVRRLVVEGAVIEIEDRAAGAPPREITGASIEVKNLTTAPSLVPEPLELDASFAAAPAVFDALFRRTIPVVFSEKTLARVRSSVSFKDWKIDWRPLLDLTNMEARAREPGGKVLGIDARKFAEALTEVRDVALHDLRIHGDAWAPEVELGDTLKNVVIEALKKRGERAAAEEIEKGLSKLEGKLGIDAKKKIEESPAGGLLEKGKEAAGETIKEGIESLFGGEKKKKEKEK